LFSLDPGEGPEQALPERRFRRPSQRAQLRVVERRIAQLAEPGIRLVPRRGSAGHPLELARELANGRLLPVPTLNPRSSSAPPRGEVASDRGRFADTTSPT